MTCAIASQTQIAALFFTNRLIVQPVQMSVTLGETEPTARVATVVTNKIDLDEPGSVLGPFGPGADRDLGLQ